MYCIWHENTVVLLISALETVRDIIVGSKITVISCEVSLTVLNCTLFLFFFSCARFSRSSLFPRTNTEGGWVKPYSITEAVSMRSWSFQCSSWFNRFDFIIEPTCYWSSCWYNGFNFIIRPMSFCIQWYWCWFDRFESIP